MQEFLRAILAGEGQYCIVGLKKGDARPAIQFFTPNLSETQKVIDTFVAERRDVYFALSTFNSFYEYLYNKNQPSGKLRNFCNFLYVNIVSNIS